MRHFKTLCVLFAMIGFIFGCSKQKTEVTAMEKSESSENTSSLGTQEEVTFGRNPRTGENEENMNTDGGPIEFEPRPTPPPPGLEKFDNSKETLIWTLKLQIGAYQIAKTERKINKRLTEDKLERELLMMIAGIERVAVGYEDEIQKLRANVQANLLIEVGKLYSIKAIEPDLLRTIMRKMRQEEDITPYLKKIKPTPQKPSSAI